MKMLFSVLNPFGGSVDISYTKLSTFKFCPFKYKLIYINGWHIPSNPYISLGLTVHNVLDEYHKRSLGKSEEILSLYDELWVNNGFSEPSEALEFYQEGRHMIEDFYDWDKKRRDEGVKTIYTEKNFSFNIKNGRYIVMGIIDRIDRYPDGKVEVIDYKTHREEWSKERLEGDLQLTIYSIGLKNSLGLKADKLSYYFLYRNEYVSASRGEKDEKAALDEIEFVGGRIYSKKFEPRHESCSRCDFRRKCPQSAAKEG